MQQILAYSLDYPDWNSFKNQLDTVRAQVHAVFDQVFSLSRQEVKDQHSQQIWIGAADDAELLDNLSAFGFQQTDDSLAAIKHFKNAASSQTLDEPKVRRFLTG